MVMANEAKEIRKMLDDESNVAVSVALFGQPGAGKSSLINSIIGKKVAEVGVETDKTTQKGEYEHNGLKFVDLPGYGTTNFPKETYFDQFDIPAFDLFLCTTSGKLHQADTEFFQELSKRGKTCIFVVNKHDQLWEGDVSIVELQRRKIDDIEKHVGSKVSVVFTSCRTGAGLDALNTEIQSNLDGIKKDRWLRSAKAYSQEFLDAKKTACEKYVTYASLAAAANGINPIPGVDISVDLAVLMKLFKEIRNDYGLNDEFLSNLKSSTIPVVGRLANNVVEYAAKEGLLMLLKACFGKQTIKMLSKYIPFVGQAVAAGLGYAITSNAGTSYLNDCHQLAEEALRNNLKN